MNKPHNCYHKLIQGLEKATGYTFPSCLSYLEAPKEFGTYIEQLPDVDICTSCENDLSPHQHCSCGRRILYLNVFENTLKGQKVIIGNICVEALTKDLSKHASGSDVFNSLFKQWKIYSMKVKQSKKKSTCAHCLTPWTHNRCFHAGLCKDCKFEYKGLLNTKITLPKYKNQTLRQVSQDKDHEQYMDFIIEKGYRHADTFKQFRHFLK
jgi:hypothetical protein